MDPNRKRLAVVLVTTFLAFSVLAAPAVASSDPLSIAVDTTLTENHIGSIVIEANGVTLDCNGYSVIGPGTGTGLGITISGRTGVTITNCHVTGFDVGIQLIFGDNNVLRDNQAEGNILFGFALFESSLNTMVGNTAHANDGHGFGIGTNSDWNTVESNTVTDNGGVGILLFEASNNDVRDNSATGNNIGLAVQLGGHNTLTDNTANGNGDGFVIDRGDYTVLRDNQADRNTETGFGFLESSSNTVVGNRAFHNGDYGFWVVDPLSVSNHFQENHACQNGLADAEFDGSSSVLVDNKFCDVLGNAGTGELMASFNGSFGGGSAVFAHSDVAAGLASPQLNPEGRLEPFGVPEFVCDEMVVGTWVIVLGADQATLDAWTNEFKLNWEVLDTVRTPNKLIAQGGLQGLWWFAEGVPVLGVLDPGLHDIEFSFDDGFGTTFTFNTPVDVASAHC